MGGTVFWTRILGTARARELFLLNERYSTEQALALGMVNAVLPAAELRAHTMDVARRLVRVPASLLALVKDNLNEAEDEVNRRRWLFAHEAHNMGESARLIAERLASRVGDDRSDPDSRGG